MNDNQELAQLNLMWASGPELYSSLKRECEGRVVRWEWSTNECYHLEHYWFELYGHKRGRKLSSPPEKIVAQCQYGFDAIGRQAVERKYVTVYGDVSYHEAFRTYFDDRIEEYAFNNNESKPITIVRRAILTANKISTLYMRSAKTGHELSYNYCGDSLSRIKYKFDIDQERNFVLEYDEAGNLEKILGYAGSEPEGEAYVRYHRPPPNVKQKQVDVSNDLVDRIVTDLTRLIKLLRAEHPNERCYGIVLVLTADGEYIECTFGTDEALNTFAVQEQAERDKPIRDELVQLRQVNRWSVYSCFHFYDFDRDTVLQPLAKGFEKGILESGSYQTWDICLAALVRLNELGILAREFPHCAVALAIENGEDSRFVTAVKKANTKAVANQVIHELKTANKAMMKL